MVPREFLVLWQMNYAAPMGKGDWVTVALLQAEWNDTYTLSSEELGGLLSRMAGRGLVERDDSARPKRWRLAKKGLEVLCA